MFLSGKRERFEYITLLIHPLVMERSGHSPVIEIFIFMAIASILSPTHHKIESWLKSKLESRYDQRITRAIEARAAAEGKAAEEEARALEEAGLAMKGENPRQ